MSGTSKAEIVARHRVRHPERVEAQRLRSRAKSRALRTLADAHRAEFEALFAAECERIGVSRFDADAPLERDFRIARVVACANGPAFGDGNSPAIELSFDNARLRLIEEAAGELLDAVDDRRLYDQTIPQFEYERNKKVRLIKACKRLRSALTKKEEG